MEYGAAIWIDDVDVIGIKGGCVAMRLVSGDRIIDLRISHHVSRKINHAVRASLDAADRKRTVLQFGH